MKHYITTDGTDISLENPQEPVIAGTLYWGKPPEGSREAFANTNSYQRGIPRERGFVSLPPREYETITVSFVGHIPYDKISEEVNADSLETKATERKIRKRLNSIDAGDCLVFETHERSPVKIFSSEIKQIKEIA